MQRAHWHAVWITFVALLTVDLGLAILKKFGVSLPGIA